MNQVYEFGPFCLDPRNELLACGARRIHLTAKAYATLLLLVERAGSLVTKDEILAKVWPSGFIEPSNLTQTIYMLRKALNGGGAQFIETVPGRGYRFTCAVRLVNLNGVSVPSAELPSLARPSSRTRVATVAHRLAWVIAAVLALGASVSPQSLGHQRHDIAVNPQAQRDYVLGRHYWSERSDSGLSQGLHYFKAAVALDPNYAAAYSGLADTYSILGMESAMWGASSSRSHYMQLAAAAARRALALDPDSAEGHSSMAMIYENVGLSYQQAAMREYQTSLALDDKYATAHEWYSWLLFDRGNRDEALRQMARARDLDPLSPIIYFASANEFYYARKFKESSEQWQLGISILPDSEEGYLGAGLADEQLGQSQRAQRELEHALALAPKDPDALSALAHVYGRAHHAAMAQRLLDRITAIKPIPAYDVALVKEALGQQDQAVRWLAIAKAKHDMNLESFALDPRMDNLRRIVPKYVANNA